VEIILTPEAEQDLEFWVKTGRKDLLKKISKLLESIAETPFEGIGKPERLKFELTGYWSRRISKEHRLVYRIEKESILIFSLKGHYN